MAISIPERKELRENLLLSLYEDYFEKGGQHISFNKDELKSDRERDLALQYLLEKGFLAKNMMGNYIQVSITARGIDYVESKE